MPASRIDAALTEFAPEPVLCWCNGQSLESRYSSSAGFGGAEAVAKLAGVGVLRHQLGKARLPGAVRMPRFPLVAVGASHIFLFEGPIAAGPPFATLGRDEVRVVYGGSSMWRRLDLIANGETFETPQRSYTIMASGLSGARGRMDRLVAELERRGPGR
jgi:hypothetical protein